MNDEPLKEWAERRDARTGRLRAVPVARGDGPRASHLNPDVPRAIERWNGHMWEPEPSSPEPVPKPLGSGTGKHRRP